MSAMYIKKFINKFDNLKAENRLLKFVIIVIGSGCVVSSMISYKAVKYQKVVILPPAVDKRIVIQGNSVNAEYIELFSKYAMSLLLNYTPQIYDDQINDLLKLTSPRYFPSLNRKMIEMKENVKRLAITSMFIPPKPFASTRMIRRSKSWGYGFRRPRDTRWSVKKKFTTLNIR